MSRVFKGEPQNTMSISHAKITKTKRWVCFFTVLLTLFVSFSVFVFGQFGYVINPVAFWIMTALFVGFSFWSSAMEAAFSTINSAQNEFAKEALTKLLKHYEDLTALVQPVANGELIDTDVEKALEIKTRDGRRLKAKHRMASGVDRTEIVGAFASLSAILNLSLGIVLPFALIDQIPPTLIVDLSLIHNAMAKVLVTPFVPPTVDLTSQKALIFVATTLPILIFGKILPKTIGLVFAGWWISHFAGIARVVQVSLGWISLGATAPLEKYLAR